MKKVAKNLQAPLEATFKQRCVTDQWQTDVIRCHIGAAYAGKTGRFERCASGLSTTQKANLDTDLKAVMAKANIAPITKDTVQQERGSGSATP